MAIFYIHEQTWYPIFHESGYILQAANMGTQYSMKVAIFYKQQQTWVPNIPWKVVIFYKKQTWIPNISWKGAIFYKKQTWIPKYFLERGYILQTVLTNIGRYPIFFKESPPPAHFILTVTELTALISFLLSKFFRIFFTCVGCRFDLKRMSRIHIPANMDEIKP